MIEVSVRYFLQFKDQDKSPLLASIAWLGNRVMFSTKLQVETKHWLQDKQRVSTSSKSHKRTNSLLKLWRDEILQYVDKGEGRLKKTTLREECKRIIHLDAACYIRKSPLLADVVEEFLKAKSKDVKPSTHSRYTYSMSRFVKNATTLKKYRVAEIDVESIEQIFDYSLSELTNRTIVMEWSHIITFIRWAGDSKKLPEHSDVISKINDLKKKRLAKSDNPHEFVELDSDEIERVKALDLSGSLSKVRDMFMFQIYTALRFSDVKRLQPHMFDHNRQMLILRTQKTSETVELYLSPDAWALAAKHNFDMKSGNLNSTSYNRQIQLVCKEAGIDQQITLSKYQGNDEIIVSKPKYELVGSHTARRTFIRECQRKGIPLSISMAMSGHKSLETFKRYACPSESDIRSNMLKLFKAGS